MRESSNQNPIEAWEIADLLMALVDKSLVAFDEAAGRYRRLETVREYAHYRMLETGERERRRRVHMVISRRWRNSPGRNFSAQRKIFGWNGWIVSMTICVLHWSGLWRARGIRNWESLWQDLSGCTGKGEDIFGRAAPG